MIDMEFLTGLAVGALLCAGALAWPFIRLLRDHTELKTRHAFMAGADTAAETRLRQAAEDAMAKNAVLIKDQLKEMADRLTHLDKTSHGLSSQLQIFADDQRAFRQQTGALIQALKNPAARGKWGEMQLSRALELVGLKEGTHYRQQVSVTADGQRTRPDFVIDLPGGMSVVVDVKTPLDPYWDALDAGEGDTALHETALANFKKHLNDHVRQLSSKDYWRHFDTAEFVVMFLPTEGLYSLAVTSDRALIETAAENRVILASPTTIMGLLRIVMHGWQQQSMRDQARAIADMGVELYDRISAFGDHMHKIGKNLGTAIAAYNSAIGSLESKVLPQLRRFRDLKGGGDKDSQALEHLTPLETTQRALSAPELIDAVAGNNAETGDKTDKAA